MAAPSPTPKPVFVVAKPEPPGYGRSWARALAGMALMLLASKVFGLPEAEDDLLFIAVACVAGVVLAIAGIILSVYGVKSMTRARRPEFSFGQAPASAERCPRCHEHQRDGSGWCGDCTAVLVAAQPASAHHPVVAMTKALNVRKGQCDPTAWLTADHVEHRWNRKRASVGLATHHRQLRVLRFLYREFDSSLDLAVFDPADPSMVWARAWSGGRVRLFGIPTRVRHVFGCRMEGDRVAETWVAAPLPPAPADTPAS